MATVLEAESSYFVHFLLLLSNILFSQIKIWATLLCAPQDLLLSFILIDKIIDKQELYENFSLFIG